ncbi:MAG: hypothetical protein ACOYBX_07025 [Mycobacterium sp.]
MKSLIAAGLLAAMALLAAPSAAANPDITDPYCTGGQTPQFGQCKVQPTDPDGSVSGLDPSVGLGLDPESFPVI